MSTKNVVISGSGLWTPENIITNEELAASYNTYAEKFNDENAAAIENGEVEAKPLSSAEFIEKASGIKSRYVYVKDGILDPERMTPNIPLRTENELSDQAEISVIAARKAMAAANKSAADIDAVIVSCAYTQRYYPAIAIEVQQELGIEGFGFDMLVACSAATFALQRACEMIAAGTARGVLVINPELTSPQNNFRDRDSHFIFGDVATATIVESADTCTSNHSYEILAMKAATVFSNNIRSNIGYMVNANNENPFSEYNFFHQEGRKVFKEVCPLAAEHIVESIQRAGLDIAQIKRWWLHQANINMNQLIAKKILGHLPGEREAPIVLDRYANTASAGSLIAFNLHHEDLVSGDHGLICSFGAGYSIGSLVLRKR
ncbi:MAG: beta-ketoacyl-ACP synthase III [Gammaproteobacteria bacterium]|mgnify:CR=1 FL=1|jgi:beta-ketodecanoyl-[acyl-carrier-protein] synthase|nr:beta-ketoacyl-ACP synthase III [Gammaproteobacteria bacterium]MBT4493853.1 beta-ketoacyl-ACP synthase III [Gammaproteobacteria bacterium]